MIYEKNIILKNPLKVSIRFGLCYPNVYRTAMSSLGYQLVYNLINEREDSWCERIIYPNFRSIESNSPMKDYNILSFSLQYEEDYFNVLKMLKCSGIPLKRKDRNEKDPLIIAGGPCASSNPMPLADYIDLFIIGDGELVINKLLNKYINSQDKNLEKYLNIPGVYIPEYNNKTKIAILEDMDNAYQVKYPIVTETDENNYKPVFNNSIMLNVSRGCTRGCRFCMSGYLYRPSRETSIEKLFEIAEESRKNTGLNKVVLIGPGVSDYSKINKLIEGLQKRGFQISTPSMRIESITKETLKSLKRSGLKTLTIAPESIYSLRKSLNKDISDEKIFEVINEAIKLDFNLKLYFLIGIPNEKNEDIINLAEYIKSIAKLKNKKNYITFSINPLIPKPHTPLQWESYNLKDIKTKTRILKKELKNVDIKIESPKKGLIQYILSCGNSAVGQVLEKSLENKITLKEWKQYIPNYSIKSELPWNKIDIGINNKFLENENKRITNGKQTPWCEISNCYNCGSCEKS